MPGISPIIISPMFGSRVIGSAPIPDPPYAVFSEDGINVLSSINGLGYQQGDTPPESVEFDLLGAGLSPAMDDITVTLNSNFSTNFEFYNPDTTAWEDASTTIAYTGGAITLSGFKVRMKTGLAATSYSGTISISAPNTTPFVLTCSGEVTVNPDAPKFIFTIKTNNAGSSASNQITIPLYTGQIYNAVIEWGDGNTDVQTTDVSPTHTYSSPGTYQIKISGDFPAILFAGMGDRLKLLSIDNWGTIVWNKFDNAFRGCQNLVANFTDVPDISNCTNLISSFENCPLFNGNLNACNTSNILSVSQCFYLCSAYNQPMDNWDMSSCLNFNSFLESCTAFNQNLNSWDTTSVISMIAVFSGCVNYNQPMDNWDLTTVTSIANMFVGCAVFNQDISGWVTNALQSLENTFLGANAFNGDISGWNVASVTNMSQTFFNAFAFDRDLGGWNISNVITFMNFTLGKSAADYSAANLDSIYNNWSLLTVQPNLSINFGSIKYTAAGVAGRAILTGAPNNWTITDGGI